MKIKPRYIILSMASFSVPMVLYSIYSESLYILALDYVLGYIAQGIYVYYATKRKPWELLIGIGCAIGAILFQAPMLQFVGRIVFILNGVGVAWFVLKEKGY